MSSFPGYCTIVMTVIRTSIKCWTIRKTFCDVRKLRAGKPYLVLRSKDCASAEYLVYEESPYSFIKYDINGYCAERFYKPVERKMEVVHGIIEQGSSLYKSMIEAGDKCPIRGSLPKWKKHWHGLSIFTICRPETNTGCIMKRFTWMAWNWMPVRLKLLYLSTGVRIFMPLGTKTGHLTAIMMKRVNPAKRAFLKAPVAFSRISSRYNLRRFHPVLKRVKAPSGNRLCSTYRYTYHGSG
jgi:hypothetical protein